MHDEELEKGFYPEAADNLTFTLTDEEIREISDAVRAQDPDTVHAILHDLNAADTAEVLLKVSDDVRESLLADYADSFNPEVFTEMDPELAREVLSAMPPDEIAAIVAALESDDAVFIIETLGDEQQREIIGRLSVKTRMAVEESLSFPEDSAGRLMQRKVVAVPQFWTVGKTTDYLRSASSDLPDSFYDIFMIDPAYHFKGQIPLSRLLQAPPSRRIDTLDHDEISPIPADMDQEELTHLFRRENIVSSAVVDENGRLLGMITIDDVVDVIDEKAEEDFLKLGGVTRSDLYRAVFSTARARSYWLLVNTFTALMAASIIAMFGASIEKIVALAALMPIVASMGGNAGTQALTVTVRALATREISGTNAWRLVTKEALVGLMNGCVFAVLLGLLAGLWFAHPGLGVIIAMAMTINLFVAGLCGAGVPILLHRMEIDPAVSSAVFLTTITDVVGFFAFLGLATLFLL